MEYSTVATTIEDSEDLFILAKERLLDVNAWNTLWDSKDITTTLTDTRHQRLHRDAHPHDIVKITTPDGTYSLQIDHLQYDDFPDIAGESLTMVLHNAANTGSDKHTIVIKRINKIVMVQSSSNALLPAPEHFLKSLIATGVYEIAAF